MSTKIKIITIVYILILAGIIFLADFRGTQYLLNFVGNIPYGDKIGHFGLMGIFSLLINLVLRARTVQVWKLRYLLGSLIVAAIVTLEEFSQQFVRGRTFDWSDLIFDYLGIFVFGEMARLICKKMAK
jgi:polysaccharide biosynthesis protein VpsQ